MAFDYDALNTAIKTEINSATGSFRYFPSHKWINLELGIFPKGSLDMGYNIRPDGQSRSRFEAHGWKRVQVTVEFALNSLNDSYLGAIGNCVEAVAGLSGISFTGKKAVEVNEHEFSLTPAGDIVLVSFQSIFYEIGS